MLIFAVVFVTLICSMCTGLLVPLRQLWLRVDPQYFKRVKVKLLPWLFVGVGGRRSEQGRPKSYGVIVPMFVLHIVGYLLTVALWVVVPTLYYRVGLDLDVLVIVPVAFALPFVIAVVITEMVCVRISRKCKNAEAQLQVADVEETAQPVA